MTTSDIVGSLGVALLLIAFFLNLFKMISPESRTYGLLNIIGAGLSCYASILIGFMPFVVLEGTWAIVAAIGMIRASRG